MNLSLEVIKNKGQRYGLAGIFGFRRHFRRCVLPGNDGATKISKHGLLMYFLVPICAHGQTAHDFSESQFRQLGFKEMKQMYKTDIDALKMIRHAQSVNIGCNKSK
jgi:hypothetical protein